MSNDLLSRVRLHRLEPSADAGLMIVSLPWPRQAVRPLSLDGRPTAVLPIGRWPAASGASQLSPRAGDGESPRRLLMIADGRDNAPPQLALTDAPHSGASEGAPTAACEVFERIAEQSHVTERSLLRLTWGGRSIALAMGLRHAGRTHWWEACRMVVLEETPHCRIVEMGGAIPRIVTGMAELQKYPGYKSPFLHHHNWLNGHIYARLHSNGVCEIFAHHINAKNFDEGRDLLDVVPVLAIHQPTQAPANSAEPSIATPIDGSPAILDLDGIRLDMSEVNRLGSPEQPGIITREGEWLLIQPYPGVELFGGVCPQDRTGDPYYYRPQSKTFPRGMARTLRFSLSLNPARSPRVARYLAPDWWYGLCEELVPAPLLPVSNEYDIVLDEGRRFCRRSILKLGFEDGSMPRSGSAQGDRGDDKRYEPGWEGEIPYAMFLDAWRTGNAEDYENAMRAAWYFTDTSVDHAAKLVRMHGFPVGSFAPPMNRVQACIAAHLETGDPYCLQTAEAVVEAAFRLEMNSWPRMAVGRDACFVRSAVMLYRYFDNPHFRRIAREGAMHVVHAQRPSGSFGDQGGGTGIHQWAAYITKPWMGLLATAGVIDYLELFPDEPAMFECIKRFADWMLRERVERKGVLTWAYQHDTDGKREHYDPYSARTLPLPTPSRWHQENIARLMGYCTARTGDPAYLDAWAHSFAGRTDELSGDHGTAAALQYLPWLQTKLRNAQWREGRLTTAPMNFGPRTPMKATISTPEGRVEVSR